MNRTPPMHSVCLKAAVAALAGIAALMTLVGFTRPAKAQAALEPASIRLDWLASGYHAPFFLALDRGYYRDQGIDLQIFDGKGSTTTIQVVASGAETFGAANLTTMALGVAKGMPLVAVLGLIQKSPDSIISLADAGIKTPADIVAKRGGFVATSASDRLFPAFAKSAGIDPQKVTRIQIESSARYSVLLQGNADFVIGWSFTDAFKINKQKPVAPPLLFADYGVNVLSIGIVVSKDTLANHPSLVKRFLAATVKGIEDSIKSPEAAVDAIVRLRPGADREALLAGASNLGAFVHTKSSEALPLGSMADQDWEAGRRILVEYLGMSESVASSQLYTNALLPQQAK
jgi:NitT/TauT family transport system substrate-binding protein